MSEVIEVAGELSILADGDRLRVAFRGEVVALELPDVQAALTLRRAFPRRVRSAWLLRTQAALARAGLELQVWIGGRQVGRLAGGTRPDRLAGWLGLDPMELQARPLLAMLARRRPLADRSADRDVKADREVPR